MFLDGNHWSTNGMEPGLASGRTIECRTNHLTSFSMVTVDAQVNDEII